MVEDSAFSHKIDYVAKFRKIIDLEGHPNQNIGSRVTAILRNRLILTIIELQR